MSGEILKCGKCGNDEFNKYGPYEGQLDEPGLVYIYTCTECGNQVREYNDGRVLDCHTKEEKIITLTAKPCQWKLELNKDDKIQQDT